MQMKWFKVINKYFMFKKLLIRKIKKNKIRKLALVMRMFIIHSELMMNLIALLIKIIIF